MTREEILNQYRDDRKTELLAGIWFTYKDALEAMDEYYNQAIGDAMNALREFSKDHSIRNDPSLYHMHLVQKLESLKKKQ